MKSVGELLVGRKPVSMTRSATALEAARLMEKEHVGSLLVLSPEGNLEGCFTERDLMTRVVGAGKDPAATPLADVMTRELFTAAPEERVNQVAREMQARHIRHLPVLEDGKVLGMLSLRDLLREHLEAKRHEVQALTAYIQGEGEAPQPPDGGS